MADLSALTAAVEAGEPDRRGRGDAGCPRRGRGPARGAGGDDLGHGRSGAQVPGWRAVRPRDADRRPRDEDGDDHPGAGPRRRRRAAGAPSGDRHRGGRPPRHRQEPGRDDVEGRRHRGHRPWRQRVCRRFVEAAREHDARLVGVSALLTTTMPNMRGVVEAIHAAELGSMVVIGGAPTTPEFADQIGADGHAQDAGAAVDLVRRLLAAEAGGRARGHAGTAISGVDRRLPASTRTRPQSSCSSCSPSSGACTGWSSRSGSTTCRRSPMRPCAWGPGW